MAFVATVIFAGATFWFAPRLPMADLPQHAGQVAVWHDLLLGTSKWQSLVYTNYFTPYLVGYSSAPLLSFVVPVSAALKIVHALAFYGFVAACVALRGRLGGDRRLDWLFMPGFFGYAYAWGFYTLSGRGPARRAARRSGPSLCRSPDAIPGSGPCFARPSRRAAASCSGSGCRWCAGSSSPYGPTVCWPSRPKARRSTTCSRQRRLQFRRLSATGRALPAGPRAADLRSARLALGARRGIDWTQDQASVYRYFFVRHPAPLPPGYFPIGRCQPVLLKSAGPWSVFENVNCHSPLEALKVRAFPIGQTRAPRLSSPPQLRREGCESGVS